MVKSDNLLAVLWLLRSRRRMTAAQLASELETSVRTVYRYIDALCAAGAPIISDSGPEGGYSLPENFQRAPLFFEPTELVALFQAAEFAQKAGHPYSEALVTALRKVRLTLTDEQAGSLERHTGAFLVAPQRRGGPVEPWLRDLEEAAADGASLEMSYQKLGAEAPEVRMIDPYAVVHSGGLWYVVAFCHARQALRDFRVDRIHALARTGQTFVRPDADPGWRQRFTDWIPEQVKSGEATLVRLGGTPNVIASACEHWYLRHCLVERSAREALFQVDPIGLRQLPGYLLGFGPAVRIVEPEGLRKQVERLAATTAEHHRNEKSP